MAALTEMQPGSGKASSKEVALTRAGLEWLLVSCNHPQAPFTPDHFQAGPSLWAPALLGCLHGQPGKHAYAGCMPAAQPLSRPRALSHSSCCRWARRRQPTWLPNWLP